MKQIIAIIISTGILISASAQDTSVSVTTNKTTTLVFPFPILHVDRGSKDLLVEDVNEAKNIVLVKAAVPNFEPTNMTVITSDESIYNFNISYSKDPGTLVYKLPAQSKASIATYANSIMINPGTKGYKGYIRSSKWLISLAISGIYVKENTIFFQVRIYNNSPIDYDIDFIRFYIKDKKKEKRTAVQELEQIPKYITGNLKQVKAHQRTTLVFALEKFTIPDAKYLAIEMMEKNGGRNVAIKVSNREIMKSISLPDLH